MNVFRLSETAQQELRSQPEERVRHLGLSKGVTEASTCGFPVGLWPDRVKFEDAHGVIRTMDRAEQVRSGDGDLILMRYRDQHAVAFIEVMND